MLKNLEEYEKALLICDKAEEEYINAPEDIEKENAFDKAYETEYNACTRCVAHIVEFSKGAIDFHKAKYLVKVKTEELKQLSLKSLL